MDGNSESSVLLSAHDGHDKLRDHRYNMDAGVCVLLINYSYLDTIDIKLCGVSIRLQNTAPINRFIIISHNG